MWTLQICDPNVYPTPCINKTFTLTGTETANAGASGPTSLSITSFSQSVISGALTFNVVGSANIPLNLIDPNANTAGIGSSSTEHPLSVIIKDKANSLFVSDFYVFTTGGATAFNIQEKVFSKDGGMAEYSGDFTLEIQSVHASDARATKDFTVDLLNTPASTPAASTPTASSAVSKITIENLEIYEEGTQTKYKVTGTTTSDLGNENLIIKFIKPDGANGLYGASMNADSELKFTHEATVGPTNEMGNGLWTIQILKGYSTSDLCSTVNMCVQRTFTGETSYSAPAVPAAGATLPPLATPTAPPFLPVHLVR